MEKTNKALSFNEVINLTESLKSKIAQDIFGQEDLVLETICCFLAGGHILMTGAPGLAKTTLVRVFAGSLGLNFGRIQFTPDLLPSDITGSEILNIDDNQRRKFEFSKGPIFVNLLLADEINRASPKTQSSMLEAMQERKVTVGNNEFLLPNPFMVFATQNPFESEGTFVLPEAQLDRFLIHSLVAYPKKDEELKILQAHSQDVLVGEQHYVDSKLSENSIDLQTILAMMSACKQIKVEPQILEAINDLVRSTRPDDELCPTQMKGSIWYGAGPRAGISLVSTARAYALIEGSEVVRWRHVVRMAKPVLRHRIKITSQALRDQVTEDSFIESLVSRVEERYHHLAQGLSS